MGFMRHNAIVITGSYDDWIYKARKKAKALGLMPTNITKLTTNGYQSFMVPPDGSKEGWDTSDIGNVGRDNFISWIHEQDDEYGSNPLDWAEIQYGSDDGITQVTRASR